MSKDASVRGGRSCLFPSYSSISPEAYELSTPCNYNEVDDSSSVESYEEPKGLSKIQSLLRRYSEESSWPSFTLPPTGDTMPLIGSGSRNVRTSIAPTKYIPIRRSTLILWSMMISVLLVFTVHLWKAFPTPEEQDMARHYYGDSSLYSLPGSTLQMRRAQDDADRAFAPLLTSSSLNQRSLRKKHRGRHHHVEVERITDAKVAPDETQALNKGCETTVLILRHCEKGTVAEHCAYDGFERSVYLADNVFGHRWPYPSAIFVENPSGRRNPNRLNFREIETVGPLAEKSNITIDDFYNNDNVRHMTKGMLEAIQSGLWCGRVVVIVWKHSAIAHIGRLLGCGPMQGCPLDYHGRSFDQVWQLKFVYRDWVHSERKHHFGPTGKQPSWKVFGSVQDERFDPLAVSYNYGDYPAGGTSQGGRWRSFMEEFPERKSKHDSAGWETKHTAINESVPAP